MQNEVAAYERCQKLGILVPNLYKVDYVERKLYMQYFDKSITIKSYITDIIDKENKSSVKELQIEGLAYQIRRVIGNMHLNDMIHGDLMTTNMLINLSPKLNTNVTRLIMIDFGLGDTKINYYQIYTNYIVYSFKIT